MLDSNQLLNLIKNKKIKNFVGVFPKNKLPRTLLKSPFSIIINLDEHYKPGSHWVAIYSNKKIGAFYFDPFGNIPPPEIIIFLDRNSKKIWRYNSEKFQNDYSTLCGLYCINFLKFCPNIKKFYKIFAGCKNNEKKLK